MPRMIMITHKTRWETRGLIFPHDLEALVLLARDPGGVFLRAGTARWVSQRRRGVLGRFPFKALAVLRKLRIFAPRSLALVFHFLRDCSIFEIFSLHGSRLSDSLYRLSVNRTMGARYGNTSMQKRVEQIKLALRQVGEMRPGSLNKQRTVCGRPGCCCQNREHPKNMALITSSATFTRAKARPSLSRNNWCPWSRAN